MQKTESDRKLKNVAHTGKIITLKYAPFVYASLLLEPPSRAIKRTQIIRDARYILGDKCPKGIVVRIDETLNKLNKGGFIIPHQKDMLLKRRLKKLQHYPLAEKVHPAPVRLF